MAKVLNPEIVKKTLVNDDLKYKLAKANVGKGGNDATISTITRWLRQNDQMLTTATNLEIIAEFFEVATADLLVEEPKQLEVA